MSMASAVMAATVLCCLMAGQGLAASMGDASKAMGEA